MLAAAAPFLPSLAVRDITVGTVLGGLGVALAAGAFGLLFDRGLVAADWRDARRRWLRPWRAPGHPWPLLAVVVVCGVWTIHFLHQAYVYTRAGLYSGYINIWGDWAAHLSFTGSFAYGHNFPPEYPIDTGHRMGYPFMIDFLAADLVPLGLSLTQSITATSAMLGLAFPMVLYLAALRFTAGRAASTMAVFVFLLSGGLGFVYLISDLQHGGLAVLAHLPREYTLNRDVNLQWLNPVLAYLVPQRSTLFGFSLVLILLVVIWIAIRQESGWRPFVFAGVVAGLMPVFHVHAYGTVVALSAFWAVFNLRREWLGFFIPALVIGVPVVLWMLPPDNTSVCGDLAGLLRLGSLTAVVAVVMMVLLGLSGALDLARASDFDQSKVLFTDPGGLKVADWVRRNTSPTAVFAVAPEHNSPIPTLAGRRELIGYPGWLWPYGLADYVQKTDDDNKILQGDPAAPDLVRKYGIDYVMIGPQEIPRGANRAYWEQHATVVYDDGEYAVYRVR